MNNNMDMVSSIPPPFDRDTPTPPNLITAQDGSSHLICPRCGRSIEVFEHDEENDKWLLMNRCMVCGQAIYDEQR